MGGAKPLAVTMGDPAGIGPEITAKAWHALRESGPVFYVAAPREPLQSALALCRLPPPTLIAHPSEAAERFSAALPVFPPASGGGDPARTIMASIEAAVAHARDGAAAAVVTNPIHKKSLYDAGFDFPGHTEYLAHLTRAAGPPVMMLVIEGLRVVPVTVHLSVAAAVKTLTTEAILHAGRITARELTAKFRVARPRLAVAALNPHAGEGGALGDEEIRIIAPAVAALQAEGIQASGPHPVDTLFHPAARARYDAALCMLHDHALLPLKTLDFHNGVNVTLGLPIVRTSPDHGTALDIAGKGVADPASLIAALRLAAALANRA